MWKIIFTCCPFLSCGLGENFSEECPREREFGIEGKVNKTEFP